MGAVLDFAIVTAADAAMERLARDLCVSLGHRARFLQIIDLGMSSAARSWFADRRVPVLEVAGIDSIEFAESYYRALYMRPHFPRMVSAETIMWIDADCWVQDGLAIDAFRKRAEARADAFAICPLLDPEYPRCISAYVEYIEGYRGTFAALFGEAVAQFLYGRAVFSCGVFCASRHSPIWGLWAEQLNRIYGELKPTGGLGHIAEQCALNRLLHETGLFEVMPSSFNWHCHCSNMERRGNSVVILPSGRVPEIVHLCDSKRLGDEYRAKRLLYEPPTSPARPLRWFQRFRRAASRQN